MFTLDQARAFVAVAEEQHFGRAAIRLHMTQPPLSRQIQKLEKGLGVQLLLRRSTGVELTVAGAAFLNECRGLLEKADRAPQEARLIAQGQMGTVRLAYTGTSAFSVLGPLLTRLQEHAPNVEFELYEMVSSRQLDALRSGTIDVGIARPPFPPGEVESCLLLTESLVVAAPAEHPLSQRKGPVSVSELQYEQIIMHSFEHAQYFRDLVTRLVEVRSDQISHTASQVLTMVALVAAGHGLAFVPESARKLGIPGVELLALQESPRDLVQLYCFWLSSSVNPALHRILPILGESLGSND